MALLLTTGLWFTGCSNGDQQQQIDQLTHQLDSMKQENDKKDGDIDEMNQYVSILADGLDSIARQEQMLFYTNKGVEGTIIDRNQLKKNLDTFQILLSNQKQQIAAARHDVGEVDHELPLRHHHAGVGVLHPVVAVRL